MSYSDHTSFTPNRKQYGSVSFAKWNRVEILNFEPPAAVMTLNCNRTLYTDGRSEISRSDSINMHLSFFLVNVRLHYAGPGWPTCAANKILAQQHCSRRFLARVGVRWEIGHFVRGNNRAGASTIS